MMFGLKNGELESIRSVLSKYPEIEKAMVFGSRAMGNFKPGSDFDLALFGREIPRQTILSLYDKLNEVSNLPYHFDIVNYNEISSPDFKKHIDDFGVTIWNKRRR